MIMEFVYVSQTLMHMYIYYIYRLLYNHNIGISEFSIYHMSSPTILIYCSCRDLIITVLVRYHQRVVERL